METLERNEVFDSERRIGERNDRLESVRRSGDRGSGERMVVGGCMRRGELAVLRALEGLLLAAEVELGESLPTPLECVNASIWPCDPMLELDGTLSTIASGVGTSAPKDPLRTPTDDPADPVLRTDPAADCRSRSDPLLRI